MPDQLTELAAEFRAISDRAKALSASLGPRIIQRPASGGWSVAECLEHLNLTTRAFVPLWSAAIAKAEKGDGPYALDFWGKLLTWMLEPPSRMKMPTTPNFQPATAPLASVLPEFLAGQQHLLAAIASCHGFRIDKVKVTSPFNARMHYSVYASFRICAAHHRRHLAQADRAAATLQSVD